MLSQDRQRIDEIDEQIVSLLEERYDCVSHIAKIKRQSYSSFWYDKRRSRIRKIRQMVSNEDYADSIVETFNQIMMVSKDYQKVNNKGNPSETFWRIFYRYDTMNETPERGFYYE